MKNNNELIKKTRAKLAQSIINAANTFEELNKAIHSFSKVKIKIKKQNDYIINNTVLT